MIGKTNLTFISKGEASSVQLIQKNYVTDATGEIYKMEIINNRFFAFVGGRDSIKTGTTSYTGFDYTNNVLMGADVGDMNFVKKDNGFLKATHIIYKEGKYYLVACGDEWTEIYETEDFKEYNQVSLPEIEGNKKWTGIFLDSRGKIVLVFQNERSVSSEYTYMHIYVCESLLDIANAQIGQGSIRDTGTFLYRTRLINNKIFLHNGKQMSLSGDPLYPSDNWNYNLYAGGYFFYRKYDSTNHNYALYRSRDMKNATVYPYAMVDFPQFICSIDGSYCVMYCYEDRYLLNITKDIFKVGHPDNEVVEIGENIGDCSILEYERKTYLGTGNGTIYELQLDYEGIIQRPDVTIIKTLAAKQALEQSIEYTNDQVEILKGYIDSKIQEELSVLKNNSTDVELENSGD